MDLNLVGIFVGGFVTGLSVAALFRLFSDWRLQRKAQKAGRKNKLISQVLPLKGRKHG